MSQPLARKLVDLDADASPRPVPTPQPRRTLQPILSDPDEMLLPLATVRRETPAEALIDSRRHHKDRVLPSPISAIPEKLCGWLVRHKRGFLKGSDRKWYEFVDDRCKLVVFQSPDDSLSVESFDIARSAFVVDPEFSEKPGVFSLSVDGQTIVLEAFSSDEMRRWIQGLQIRREIFLKARAMEFPSNGSFVKTSRSSSSVSAPPTSGHDKNFPTWQAGGDSSAMVCFDDILPRKPEESSANGSSSSSPVLPKAALDIPIPGLDAFQRTPSGKRIEKKPLNVLLQMFNPTDKVDKSQLKIEKALEDRVLVLKDELLLAKDELTAQREIVRVLRRQLDFTTKEKEALRTLVGTTDKDAAQMQILRDRCRLILELEESLQNSRSEKETLFQRNEILKSELLEMARQAAVLREQVRTKDHAILLLNEQLTKAETAGDRNMQRSGSQTSEHEDQAQKMRDILEAYKEKLAFLNEEIVSQNALRNEMVLREESLMALLSDWEAKYARLESRHLFTLKDFSIEQRKLPDTAPETEISQMRQRILDEALGGSEADSHVKAIMDCDKYGFFISRLHYTDEEFLERKALEAERKQRAVGTKKDVSSNGHVQRWDNFLVKQASMIQKSEELKNLMRIGCPDVHRARVWRSCVEWRISSVKQVKGANYYQKLVKDTTNPLASAAAKQIKIDLCRTLPNNIHFMNMESDLIPKLEEVLIAFSRHNPAVGYCQGMNRLVAVALLFLKEEDAFWCLTAIVDYLLPGYFTINMVEAQVDQRVFKDLFAEKLPKLYGHLSRFLDVTLYSFNWFLTVFVDNMHPDIFLPIWDAFLVEGKKILFRFSLAMFKYFEDELMNISDQTIANRFLRNLGDHVTDLNRIQNIAFDGLNPFPMKLLRTRRAVHLPEILEEMQQLEQLRASVPHNSNQDEDDM